jgi:regulatory protein
VAAPHLPPTRASDADRSARIAELAARLEFLEKSAPGVRSAPTARSGSSDRVRTVPATAADPDEGGHPEDPPGDPEAVAKAICLRLLTSAARPRAGLAAALGARGIPAEVADAVLDRFVEVGLIDDEAYARAFVATKRRDRALGAAALRTELRRKGVDEEVVAGAVEGIDIEAERSRAQALIDRRVDAAMSGGATAARRRLVALLARRGYSADIAHSVVDRAVAQYAADEECDSQV